MTKISVIIPVYNAEKHIAGCLDSVINQKFKDIEIICVNDFSQDNSAGILNEYAQKDKRIIVFNNNQNIGAANSRNIGINNAKGEYIYFIDSDDYIDNNYLGNMLFVIEKEGCDIILNLSILSESQGSSVPYKHPSMPEINRQGEYLDKISAIHDAPCFIWARLFKKSFLDKYNLRFIDTHVDDVVFNTIVNTYCEKTFVFFGENYHYTVLPDSMTGRVTSLNIKDMEHIKAYDFIYDYLKEHDKLDRRLKLFRVYPFFKVDTEEKFDCYKKFIEKIKKDFQTNENIYNELEKYFAYSLLNSSDYEEYLKNYNKIVTIGFIRQGKK